MNRDTLYQTLSVGVLVGLWQLVLHLELVHAAVLPAPTTILASTVALLGDGEFLRHFSTSMTRTVVAGGVAVMSGTVIGLAMGWNTTVRALLQPPISALYPLPVIALLPLLVLAFGSSETALVFTAAFGGFFLVVSNAKNGATRIEQVYLDAARDNGATSTYQLFREVLLPGSLPLLFTGVRLGVSTSFLIVISVELIAGGEGLGYLMWVAWNTYALEELYGTIVVIGLVGVAITYGLEYLQHRLVPWTGGSTGGSFI